MKSDVRFPLLVICFPLIILFSLTGGGCQSAQKEDSTKFTNYFRQGELLYSKHCSNCHQENGTGLGRVYPPLNQSDYMENNFEQVLCLMKYGIEGELIVNGKNYNLAMPGIPSLTDLEIAEIATYIYNAWGNKRGLVDIKDVNLILATCRP
jgi:cytochrome c551